jgi:hypothetical protein
VAERERSASYQSLWTLAEGKAATLQQANQALQVALAKPKPFFDRKLPKLATKALAVAAVVLLVRK